MSATATAAETIAKHPLTASRPRRDTRPPLEPDRVLPAWPILVLLWGMPAWWALGLLPFSVAIMAVPMIAFLVRHGAVRLTPGALPLVAFVVWMLPCALMLDSLGRMLGFGVRFGQLAAVAVALVYVLNARRTLSVRRVLAGLAFSWAFVIVGGYLGLIWPEVRITATVGAILPDVLMQSDYVSDLVYPPFSEVQTPYGAEEPFLRPSAPFAYTNGWGAAIAILTPVAVAWALERGTVRALVWLIVGILASIPPAIATTNRGLLIGIAVGLVYVLIRLCARGQWVPFAWVATLGGVLVTVLASSGLLAGILERQEVVDTTEGRGDLYAETLERTLLSPVLGYGAPRPSYVSEIAVGTQGMVWNAMFCFGFVGLALLALFFAGAIGRTWRAPNTAALWLHASLVAAAVLSVFYGLDRHLLAICLVAGLLLRERHADASAFWTPAPGRAEVDRAR